MWSLFGALYTLGVGALLVLAFFGEQLKVGYYEDRWYDYPCLLLAIVFWPVTVPIFFLFLWKDKKR